MRDDYVLQTLYASTWSRSVSTYQKSSSSWTYSRHRHHRNRCYKSNRDKKHKWEPRVIPHTAVMELFNLHHNRTPPKCFEEFIPLYPKTSSLLQIRSRVSLVSDGFFYEWLQRMKQSADLKLVSKVFRECEKEMKRFDAINCMNEPPMIPDEEGRRGVPTDVLAEHLLLFLTNVRLRDILKLKKSSYQEWSEEYARSLIEASKLEGFDGVEALYVLEKEMSNSSSSAESADLSTGDNCEGSVNLGTLNF